MNYDDEENLIYIPCRTRPDGGKLSATLRTILKPLKYKAKNMRVVEFITSRTIRNYPQLLPFSRRAHILPA